MLTDLGASVTMDGLGRFDEQIRAAGLLHVTRYLLLGEPMASRCMEAIAIANQEQIRVSIDVARSLRRRRLQGSNQPCSRSLQTWSS